MPTIRMSRRRALATGAAAALFMPAFSRANSRPRITHGLQSGDVTRDGAVIWARADRPCEMTVEAATTESFRDPRRLPALAIGEATDDMGKMRLTGMPSDAQVFYRVTMTDLTDRNAVSEPVTGSFRTVPGARRDVSFVWSADTVGQGWGIDAGRGRHADLSHHAGAERPTSSSTPATRSMPTGRWPRRRRCRTAIPGRTW